MLRDRRSVKMSLVSVSFEEAVSYALEKLQCSSFTLRSEQSDAIKHLYEGRDVFLWLPTGFGKSICYETLPFMFDCRRRRRSTTEMPDGSSSSLVLVVSPLIALMVDQVRSLRRRSVRAAIVTPGTSSGVDKELRATEEDFSCCSFLFCTPEALVTLRWRDTVESPVISGRIVAVAVDEAHCVSKWSKDFRPAYARIHEVRALIPAGIPFLACTATATRSVRREVVSTLDMEGCEVVSTSPNRPNIFYGVQPRSTAEADLQPLLASLIKKQNRAPRMIVYCRTLDICADLYAYFHDELGDASYYPPGASHVSDNRLFGMFHADTPDHNKDVILRSFSDPTGVVRVVFATVALGMGVNFSDVNDITHYGAPQSLDDYFQESGRAGRSGAQAKSVVFWKPSDCPRKKEHLSRRDVEVLAVREYVENNAVCRRKWLLNYFDHECVLPASDPSLCCDVCARQERS